MVSTSSKVVTAMVILAVIVVVTVWLGAVCGAGVWIRRLFGCTTIQDEEVAERRAANRRNLALQASMGAGSFVPHSQATVGANIYNPWAGQRMEPEGVPAAPKPADERVAGGYQAGPYPPGRAYPIPYGGVSSLPMAMVMTPPPAYQPC